MVVVSRMISGDSMAFLANQGQFTDQFRFLFCRPLFVRFADMAVKAFSGFDFSPGIQLFVRIEHFIVPAVMAVVTEIRPFFIRRTPQRLGWESSFLTLFIDVMASEAGDPSGSQREIIGDFVPFIYRRDDFYRMDQILRVTEVAPAQLVEIAIEA